MLLEEYDHDLEMKKIEYSLTEAITERVIEGIIKDVTERLRDEMIDPFMNSASEGLREKGISEKDIDEFVRKVTAQAEKDIREQVISLIQ